VIVSISRELGAGGRSVGEAVAAALGAPLLDERSIIEELARREGVPAEYVADRVERAPTRGERFIADLAAATAMLPVLAEWRQSDELVVAGVRELVMEYAQRGHVVVIGHGGVALLGWRPAGIPVLAALLRAGRAWRVAQLARRLEIDAAEAERRIARVDEARARYQRHYFNSDIYDSRQYDLVLNAESLGLDRAIAIACDVASALAAAHAPA
jgi:cytidylate kinase